MKLLNDTLKLRFLEVGDQSQKEAEDTIVIAKFFNPCGAGTWYATEYFPENNCCFGYVSIFGDHNDELGDFSIDELEEYKNPMFGLGIERDLHWNECSLKSVMTK